MAVEVFESVARCLAQSARASPHIRSDKGQPDIAYHSHSWTKARSRAARMVFEEVFYVLFDYTGKFFDCQRHHTKETCAGRRLDVKAGGVAP